MTTIKNEVKEILATLKKETKEMQHPKMSNQEKDLWLGKLGMIESIQTGLYTDEIEIKSRLELSEMIHQFNSETHIYGTTHFLGTDNYENQILHSIYENEAVENILRLEDGQWFLNAEEDPYPSVVILLNEIELRIFGIHEYE